MFGSHLSISGGMHNALLAAEKLKLDTVQVFTKNQQQWAAKPMEEAAIREFRGHGDRLGFRQIVAHDSYLINLASTDAGLWQKSIEAFAHEMERCDQLGIAYLVTHPGAHCGAGEECGVGRVVEAMNKILDADKSGKVTVCLETTAGQGSCLGCTFEHLAEMRRKIERKDRVAVCVDTCHILAAGYDITTAAGTKGVLAELDKIVGLEHVKVFHLNDSKKALGSRVDRHEHIARGHVGLEAFRVICQDARFKNVPKILETAKDPAPDGRDWDEVNLELLRGLAAGEDARPKEFPELSDVKMASEPSAKKKEEMITPERAHILAELNGFLASAKMSYQQRNPRAAIATLHTAQTMATHHEFHKEAAIFRRALALLSTGAKPKLLTNPHSTLAKKER